MFKLPEDFKRESIDYREEGTEENPYPFYMSEVGPGYLEHKTLKSAVLGACECIDEHEKAEFITTPISIYKYICVEGFCSPVETLITANSVEEFYSWIHEYFNI